MAMVPNPICAVCQRPVERVTSGYDLATATMMFTLRCHGDVEQIVIPYRELVEACAVMLNTTWVAFASKPLSPHADPAEPR